jgi:uncharacterized Zn-finger protein
MARTTRGSSASPTKASPAKGSKAATAVVATPGSSSPRKVGRPPKAETIRRQQQEQEIPTPPQNSSKSSTPTKNGKNVNGSGSGDSSRKFNCPYCGQAFSRKYDMEKHSRKHTGDKPYKCV